jgi:16S rRNA (guanine(966)-N(2))-methyltransferase RsmD
LPVLILVKGFGMRVIAGKARRIQLITPEGMNTRPTTDRIKETLFNMISSELYDCRFLDLFSGSGGIGIEALSRGAKKCTFVENNSEALRCIKENLKKTRLEEAAEVIKTDAVSAVKSLALKGEEPYDIIFMDPPYNNLYEKEVLDALKDTALADENTTIIIEASLETETEYIEKMGFCIDKIKKYKTNKHIFVYKEK